MDDKTAPPPRPQFVLFVRYCFGIKTKKTKQRNNLCETDSITRAVLVFQSKSGSLQLSGRPGTPDYGCFRGVPDVDLAVFSFSNAVNEKKKKDFVVKLNKNKRPFDFFSSLMGFLIGYQNFNLPHLGIGLNKIHLGRAPGIF